MGAGAEPRSVVESLHETINSHDLRGVRALFAPDARLVAATGRMLTPTGLSRMLADTLTAFPDLKVSVERWVVADGVVVTEERMEGTHQGDFAGLAPTGRPVELRLCHVARVAGGLFVERISYHDTAAVLRQLG